MAWNVTTSFPRNDLSQTARQTRLTSSRMPKHNCRRTHSPWIKPCTKGNFRYYQTGGYRQYLSLTDKGWYHKRWPVGLVVCFSLRVRCERSRVRLSDRPVLKHLSSTMAYVTSQRPYETVDYLPPLKQTTLIFVQIIPTDHHESLLDNNMT